MANFPAVPTRSGRPEWHYAAGIGSTWHGLDVLGARDPAELERMGFDIVYFDGAPPGAEPVVDVHRARVVFPVAGKLDLTGMLSMPPSISQLRPVSDLAWPFTWSMKLADARRAGLIQTRRLANQARARLGLLSADTEDNILLAGGSIVGACGYDRSGRLISVGSAEHARRRAALVPMAGVRFKGKA